MEIQKDLLSFIDNFEVKNSLGYFIKIFVTETKGTFLSQTTKESSFFVESLKEIPYKYMRYIVTDIDIIKPTNTEIKTLKKFYQNIKTIPCILEIKIESKED